MGRWGSLALAGLLAISAPLAGFGVESGERVVLVGDSITWHGATLPGGHYHVLTNVVRDVTFIPLGFSGHTVGSWLWRENDSIANTNIWASYRPDFKYNLHTVFADRVDVLVVFLGMNDILMPTMDGSDDGVRKWLQDYRRLLANFEKRCHPRLFVLATGTPLTADPDSPKNRVRLQMAEGLRQLAQELPNARVAEYGAAVVRGIEETRRISPTYRLVPDFVHPNAVGHLLMAEALCRALDRPDEAAVIAGRYEAAKRDLVMAQPDLLTSRIVARRSNRPQDVRPAYDLICSLSPLATDAAKVRVVLPEGWEADRADVMVSAGASGMFVVRGEPTRELTPIRIEAEVAGKTVTSMVNVPAPWCLADETGVWRFYTATVDYTGGPLAGSIDPYQLYFGTRTNVLRAARRVWSPTARTVKAVLSHQTFSATLGFSVRLNGREVWREDLNRSGKKRVEKPVDLKAGWNAVEIVCTNRDWQRQFAFDLVSSDDQPLDDLRYDLKSDTWQPVPFGDVRVGGVIGERIALTVTNNLMKLDLEKDFVDQFRTKSGKSPAEGLRRAHPERAGYVRCATGYSRGVSSVRCLFKALGRASHRTSM